MDFEGFLALAELSNPQYLTKSICLCLCTAVFDNGHFIDQM